MEQSTRVEFVKFEIESALEKINTKKNNNSIKKLIAVLNLKQLANKVPVLFQAHVNKFLKYIINAIHDKKSDKIRIAAAKALREVLFLVYQRPTTNKQREECFRKVYSILRKGINNARSGSAVHGSLLAGAELLELSKEFIMADYFNITDAILSFKYHRDPLVRQTVISLIPKCANFSEKAFVSSKFRKFATIDGSAEDEFEFNDEDDDDSDHYLIYTNNMTRNLQSSSTLGNNYYIFV